MTDLVLRRVLLQILQERIAGHLNGHGLLQTLQLRSQLPQNRLHVLFLCFLITDALLDLDVFVLKWLTEEKLILVLMLLLTFILRCSHGCCAVLRGSFFFDRSQAGHRCTCKVRVGLRFILYLGRDLVIFE